MKLQADVETDEVYAQLTLQPLTPVESSLVLLFCIKYSMVLNHLRTVCTEWSFLFLMVSTARAEGYISSDGVGNSKQAANKLLLQDIDSE